MSNEPRAPRLAVLIDAENASSRIATRLFEEFAKIGEASVRRIYGDFSGTRLKCWAGFVRPMIPSRSPSTASSSVSKQRCAIRFNFLEKSLRYSSWYKGKCCRQGGEKSPLCTHGGQRAD